MPKITTISLQKNNKNRCNLFIDGEFYKGISLESVYKNRLKEGQEISLDKLDYILMENERNDALSKALNYISKTLKNVSSLDEISNESILSDTIRLISYYNFVCSTLFENYIKNAHGFSVSVFWCVLILIGV